MMNLKQSLLTLFLATSQLVLYGQDNPVVVQAEAGTLGSSFTTVTQSGVTYATIIGTGAGQNPGSASRVISYTVTFPSAGTYDLYARIRVGSGTFNDDSFYYGNGFGAKSPTSDNDWITSNGLSPVGFTTATDVVTGAGTASNNVWKWINLSRFDGGETPVSFVVSAANLVQTFQIGAREDGLDIDKFVFGRAGTFFKVSNLDNGEPGSTNPPPPPFTPPGPPIATGKQKFLGGVYSTPQLPNFTKYWNLVVAENAGKWGSVEATRDVMNWTELDAAYKLAKDNGYPFRMHVLIWGNQQPSWIENLPPAEQLEEIREWYSEVAKRYPGIDFLEVVNEPTNDPPNSPGSGGGNYINALGGNGSTGWDWVINAFRLARQYFPNAKLMINDYSVENTAANAQRYLGIIKLLKQENLIDIIGVQGHAFSTRFTSAANLKANLDILASSNLPIHITELDIDGTDDQVQLQEYQRIFPVFWEHPSVKSVTLWGYRPGHWRTAQGAYIAYENGAERPALVWLRQYVSSVPNVAVTSFSCSYTNQALSSVSFVLGYDNGAYSPALPPLFINGVTGNGQLGTQYTYGFDNNQSTLAIQDMANLSTYFVWNFREACAAGPKPVDSGTFAITAVTGVICKEVSPTQRTVTFTPQYGGLNGQAVTFSVINEMMPTTNGGPYTLNLYTDNPTINLRAEQAGTVGAANYPFNWVAACAAGPQPVPAGTFAITAVTGVSCTEVSPNLRAVTFTPQYSGLNEQTVTFSVVNETLPTTNSGPYTLNLYTDNPTVNLRAEQAGTINATIYPFNWLAACPVPNTRMAADEPGNTLQVLVLGNPSVTETVKVEVRGAAGQLLRLNVLDSQGRMMNGMVIEQATSLEQASLRLDRSAGLYFIQALTPTQKQVVKVIKQN